MATTDRSPRMVRLLTVLVLVGTFVAGGVTGAGLTRWAGGPGDPRLPPPGPIPFHALDLNEDQQHKVREILEAHRGELEAVLHEAYPKVQAINEQVEREVRLVLTPEQRAHLDEIKARRPPPPPRPGPDPGPGMGPGPGPGPGPGFPPPPLLSPPPFPPPPPDR